MLVIGNIWGLGLHMWELSVPLALCFCKPKILLLKFKLLIKRRKWEMLNITEDMVVQTMTGLTIRMI